MLMVCIIKTMQSPFIQLRKKSNFWKVESSGCYGHYQTLITKKEIDEIVAFYGCTHTAIYKWFAAERHSWSSPRKERRHIWNFCSSHLTMEQTFVKSLNAGQRPGYHQRIWWPNILSVATDHQSSVSILSALASVVITLTTTVSTPSSHVPSSELNQTIFPIFLNWIIANQHQCINIICRPSPVVENSLWSSSKKPVTKSYFKVSWKLWQIHHFKERD